MFEPTLLFDFLYTRNMWPLVHALAPGYLAYVTKSWKLMLALVLPYEFFELYLRIFNPQLGYGLPFPGDDSVETTGDSAVGDPAVGFLSVLYYMAVLWWPIPARCGCKRRETTHWERAMVFMLVGLCFYFGDKWSFGAPVGAFGMLVATLAGILFIADIERGNYDIAAGMVLYCSSVIGCVLAFCYPLTYVKVGLGYALACALLPFVSLVVRAACCGSFGFAGSRAGKSPVTSANGSSKIVDKRA